MAYHAWVKKEEVLLKVQEGIGDNLLHEDIANGYVDYVLWSTFKPEDLDLDQELTMECLDGGMVLFKEPLEPETLIQTTLPEAFKQAFNRTYTKSSCIVLLEGLINSF